MSFHVDPPESAAAAAAAVTLARTIEGTSPAMLRLREAMVRVARFPTSVLLTGETGTGKGEIARALHAASPSRGEPFVHVDCAGLVEGLLEAELYGVARGGYTGASQSRAGRFETAGRGTLFLDEVGELAPAGQTKLLRALEEGTFERIGETVTRRLRARVVAATHVDLEEAVSRGRFRADLYYRLVVLRLEVPPLRERREDLPLWIARAADKAAQRLGCAPPCFDDAALARLQLHAWPGNLRELFHLVEAAAVLSESSRIAATLVDHLLGAHDPAGPVAGGPGARPTSEIAEIERADGNLSLAARRLGVPRSTLRYRLGLDDALSRGRRLRERRSRPDAARPPTA